MTLTPSAAVTTGHRRSPRLPHSAVDGTSWLVTIGLFVAGSHWEPNIAAFGAVAVGMALVGCLRALRWSSDCAELERLQAMFSQYVGVDVARRAVRCGTELGGEEVAVGVLFVDLVDFTGLVSTRAPREVARLLNEFYRIVVDTVERNVGYVNKFEGDAALAVFGAPREHSDAYGAALVTARDMRAAFAAQFGSYGFGIGVSAGRAFAGHVGARSRLEYTVIGEPVNEAARLSELAKAEPGRVLASATALDGASPAEVSAWDLGESVLLRGRRTQTVIARPVDVPASPSVLAQCG